MTTFRNTLTSLQVLLSYLAFSSAFTNPAIHLSSLPRLDALSSSATDTPTPPTPSSPTPPTKKRKVNILLCPAQFCVPSDYSDLLADLQKRSFPDISIGSCRVAPLPRTEWIKVAKQLPTKRFLDADLDVPTTLDWYFRAMETGLAEILAEDEEDDSGLCIIGHSIGGWVARAFLGGMSGSSTAVSREARDRVTSFVTLGTPHDSPESAPVDQTRGLLRRVVAKESCSSAALAAGGIDVTCVGSAFMEGKILTTNVGEIVAATSYFPLLGKLGGTEGDGIIPLDLAFMDNPARRVEISQEKRVMHAHVLPTPWNLWDGYEGSIALPEEYGTWYGSKDILDEWADFIR